MSLQAHTPARQASPGTKARVRRALISLLGNVLEMRGRPLEQCGLNSFLVIAPHPDDETFGCGGTLALCASAGLRVSVLFITDGAASHPGHPDMPPARLAMLRKDEAVRAMGILGIPPENLTFLDAPDGALKDLLKEGGDKLVRVIASAIRSSGTAAILLPSRNDGSSEHEAVFKLVQRALAELGASPRILEYPVWSWWSPRLLLRFVCSGGKVWRSQFGNIRERKLAAISSYVSQIRPIPPQVSAALPCGFAEAFATDDEYFLER